MRVFRKPKIWICLFVALSLALLLFVPVKRALDVAAVQNAVQLDWEIGFYDSSRAHMPSMVPARVDDTVWDFLSWIHYKRGYEKRNRREVNYQRFLALFRGSIEEINVYNFEAFCGDLGAAFARFPDLRRVKVFDDEPHFPTESEWALLCARLRALPNLEKIEFGGSWLTDAAIDPLAGHPSVRRICILRGRLTAECRVTFASIPHLSELHIEGQIHEGDKWLSQENRDAMIATLPNVSVELFDGRKLSVAALR